MELQFDESCTMCVIVLAFLSECVASGLLQGLPLHERSGLVALVASVSEPRAS